MRRVIDLLAEDGSAGSALRALADTLPSGVAAGLGPAVPDLCRRIEEVCGLSPQALAGRIASLTGTAAAGLADMAAGRSLAGGFSADFLRWAGVYPYEDAAGSAVVAMLDPLAEDVVDALSLTLGPLVIRVASRDDLDIMLGRDEAAAADGRSAAAADGGEEAGDVERLRDLASGAPVVRALDELFGRAVRIRATDIHLEPVRGALRVRLRVDGILQPSPSPADITARAIVSRVKVLAGLNIAEHRLPQDGRLRMSAAGRSVDVRVATMPTTGGEAAVLRLLDQGGRPAEIGALGLAARDEAALRRAIAAPYGLVVVTGPTGSGKTTTLAAALGLLNDGSRKIVTIEDPVEYEVPGVSQSQVREVHLTFAIALRAFLRQDPDVIMVGEMRDPETAATSVQASLTGHLVLSTLHTNSAAGAVARLTDMGVEPYLLASSLRLVVGQRLVRLLCTECRRPFIVDEAVLDRRPQLRHPSIPPGTRAFEACGCERCANTGYRGRMAIFEAIEFGEPLRRLIAARAPDAEIERVARAAGTTSMFDDGLAKAALGLTSLDEVLRVAAYG